VQDHLNEDPCILLFKYQGTNLILTLKCACIAISAGKIQEKATSLGFKFRFDLFSAVFFGTSDSEETSEF